ncbi:hypothetical protein LNKW23_04670 [Paralimibaculum aggregatum]|uniref:DUF1761 domain-containing protein n=1 Tax=Paralimibaculum aggregatum TaxID=3036245 RepID=A0ABQ6LKS2_9RHOB|nr:DUF1761 domain-containing protein [Limibaculum sp. NKW23]GMG81254.1 hypothetical protein LNKW23_04670 [Limibaculum sp. NKW23]
MMFDGIDLLAVLAAAAASFVFGAGWYAALGRVWMRAAGLTEADTRPDPKVFAVAFLCQLLMAFVLAGVVYHVSPGAEGPTVRAGLISAGMIWAGFVLTTQIVNHRFQGAPWALTAVDCGHWLGVLLIQGLVIGAL